MTLPRAITMVTLFVLAIGALFFLRPASQEEPAPTFPTKLVERVALPDQERGEKFRLNHYTEDGFGLVRSDVTFKDDSEGYIFYRPDGTVSTFGQYYPEADGVAQLKMEAGYTDDGVHLEFEKHYRDDGTIDRQGKRLEDGRYMVRAFFEDGVRLASSHIHEEDGDVDTYEIWYESGVLKETLELVTRAKVTTKFAEDGTKRFLHRAGFLDEVWEYYADDGKTVLTRYEMDYESDQDSTIYFIHAFYNNPDGSLSHDRKFYRDKMMVYMRDAEGKIIAQQRWQRIEPAWTGDFEMGPEHYVLQSIKLGKDTWYAEGFYFDDTGSVVRRHSVPVMFGPPFGRRSLTKNYDIETGQLIETRVPKLVDGKIEYVTTKFEPGETTEVFDTDLIKPEWLEVYSYEVPPKVPHESEYEDN